VAICCRAWFGFPFPGEEDTAIDRLNQNLVAANGRVSLGFSYLPTIIPVVDQAVLIAVEIPAGNLVFDLIA
jgi:hypothetical protein